MKRLLFNIISYVWLCFTGLVCTFFFHVLSHTKIVGKHNLSTHRNQLIIANHLTLVDSWLLTLSFSWWRGILHPHLFPWHLPEEKNYMAKWWLKILCLWWKCIPINRGSFDFLKKIDDIAAKLRQGTLLVYPEGTRSREPKSGELYHWHDGAAVLAYKTKAEVIPIAHRGIEDVLPIGKGFPEFGKHMVVLIGRPIDLSHLYRLPERDAVGLISEVMQSRLQQLLTSTHLLIKNQLESCQSPVKPTRPILKKTALTHKE